MADKRRQVNLPGTRFSLSFGLPPPSSSLDTPSSTAEASQTSQTSPPISQTSQTSPPTSQTYGNSPTMATSTGVSPTDSPGPIERFVFGTLPSPSTCTPATFSWTYFGVAHSFSFTISQQIAPHTDRTGATRRAISDVTIASSLQTTDETWTWSSVNVTQGWYVLEALGDTWTIPSAEFFITNGTDVSCLYPSAPPSTSSPMPTSTIPSTSASTDSPTSPATAVPVGAVSSRARTGAIAGGVIGGMIILAAAIAGYVYFGLCRRAPTRSRRRTMGGPKGGQLARWGGLSSHDSGIDAPMAGKPALAVALPPNKRAKTDSTSTMLSPVSSTAHGHPAAARDVSDEDLATLTDEEKGSKGHEYIETVPPLAYTRRRSSASTSGQFSPISYIPEPPPSAGSMGRHRARSSSQSHRAMTLAQLDGNASVPASPASPRTRSPPVPRRSIDGAPMAMPASPPFDATAMNRTSSAGGPGGRRAARKPVPQLDAPEDTTSSSPTFGARMVTTASTAHPMYRNDSHSSTHLRAARQPSREDLEAAGMELPNLNHKSSFGDRPVHYLIPDMPPPPRH